MLMAASAAASASTEADRAATAPVAEPDGFRLDHYRSAVPATLRGAETLHSEALARLIASGNPILIDVLPAPQPPADPRPGLPRLPLTHTDIPGSHWLAETGRGALSPPVEARFRAKLLALTRHNRNAPLVFYCLSQCWMSWNAAKRAVAFGYRHVIWYPDGADGWRAAGHPTAAATPEP